MASQGRKKTRARTAAPPAVPYVDATREPLYCLLLLFPLIAVYEFGAMMLRPMTMPDRLLLAPSFIEDAIAWLGPTGSWVSGVLLLGTLLFWHILLKKTWHVRAWIPIAMIGESIVLTLPLFVLARLLLVAQVPAPPPTWSDPVKIGIVMSLGAGIYEEFLFRLLLIGGLVAILVDAAKLPRRSAVILAAAAASFIFAACHFQPIAAEPFDGARFALRALGGAYLSLLYLTRGLGICAACHAAFNVGTILM